MKSKNSSVLEDIDSPVFKDSRFTEMLIDANDLKPGGFERWIFCRGMQFNSPHKWWGDRSRRDFPHEGIDFCLYEDASHIIRQLDAKTRVPIMHSGAIKAIFKDYLGQAVVIEHENSANITGRFISVYAHTRPLPGIEVGVIVKEGDIIATIADTSHSKANILPHLHFSLGIPSSRLVYDGFVWNVMRDFEKVALVDPLPVIDWPHQALNATNSPCRDI
jgi:murein DD-endopeptidase MepM/ murein hydrolase activator NlpD